MRRIADLARCAPADCIIIADYRPQYQYGIQGRCSPKGQHTRLAVRCAFTLVELLVVIAILGILVALLLPAIHAAREAGRRTQCTNQVKQLALAAIAHETALGYFPTGGWVGGYVGDADRGFGREQPGGWIYNILPFMEGKDLRNLTADGLPEVVTEKQLNGVSELSSTVLTMLYCPSRREPTTSSCISGVSGPDVLRDIPGVPDLVGKTDYAINAGDQGKWLTKKPDCLSPLGRLLCPKELSHFNFRISPLSGLPEFNGVSFSFSVVRVRHITDGTSKTYLVGEKHMHPIITNDRFFHSRLTGDDLPWCAGAHESVYRSGWLPPMRDGGRGDARFLFGSAHHPGCHMSFCDGSVRLVSYDIDQLVHLSASNRHDGWIPGQPVEFPLNAYPPGNPAPRDPRF